MTLQNRTLVITGATSGLGQATAIAFAQRGARVLLVGRDAARAEETRAQAGENATVILGDVSTRAGVAAVATAVLGQTDRVDVLLNNAGGQFPTRADTADGVERTFALNVVGPSLLAQALLPALAAAQGRVVNLSTGFLDYVRYDPDTLANPPKYGAITAYASSKIAAVILAVEQADRYRADGVTAVSMHPGIILGTRFGGGQPAAVQAIMGPILRAIGLACTMEEAVRRFEVASFAELPSGSYLVKGKVATLPKAAQDADIRSRTMASIEAAARG